MLKLKLSVDERSNKRVSPCIKARLNINERWRWSQWFPNAIFFLFSIFKLNSYCYHLLTQPITYLTFLISIAMHLQETDGNARHTVSFYIQKQIIWAFYHRGGQTLISCIRDEISTCRHLVLESVNPHFDKWVCLCLLLSHHIQIKLWAQLCL